MWFLSIPRLKLIHVSKNGPCSSYGNLDRWWHYTQYIISPLFCIHIPEWDYQSNGIAKHCSINYLVAMMLNGESNSPYNSNSKILKAVLNINFQVVNTTAQCMIVAKQRHSLWIKDCHMLHHLFITYQSCHKFQYPFISFTTECISLFSAHIWFY